MLTPSSHPDLATWTSAIMRDAGELLGADQVLFALPVGDGATLHGRGSSADVAAAAYMEYFWSVDFLVAERRKNLKLEVYTSSMLCAPGEMEKSEIFNDWCVQYGVCDALGVGVEVGGILPAAVHFYHESSTADEFGDRGVALANMLLPAFKAGVFSYLRVFRLTRAVLSAVDQLPSALVLADTSGVLVHENVRFQALLQSDPSDARGAALRGACSRAAMAAASAVNFLAPAKTRPQTGPANFEVETPGARYRVSASVLAEEVTEGAPKIMVVVERLTGLSSHAVRARFHLTEREMHVARLLALGLSNLEVAQRLEISRHTAARHTERVLDKLGVHSRAAVSAMLRGDVDGQSWP
jgi:DNA-binding CsgD family transcriptional regulator